ncbi:MAG: cache domain-containing protein [Deltaproteobacteria bacterium]|nr:cache domain-containing protein [Syntrophaceae bacterium]
MKRVLALVVTVLFAVGVGVAAAQEKGTADEAKAMVKKAVAYMKEVGKDKALAEFNNPKGKFVSKDLYVWATGMDGTNLSHPYTPALIGKNMYNLKDADGKLFVQERIAQVKAKGSGTIEYRWTNQNTKKIEQKVAYFEGVPGMNLFLNCAYYK